MDSVKKRIRFSHHLIYSICGNFNYKAKRNYSRFTIKKWDSWGQCANQSYLSMNSVLNNEAKSIRAKKDKPGWTYTRLDSQIHIKKLAYKLKESWTVRSYHILEWVNQKDHWNSIKQNNIDLNVYSSIFFLVIFESAFFRL